MIMLFRWFNPCGAESKTDSIYTKPMQTSLIPVHYKNRFKSKNEIEGQDQSSQKFTGILTLLRCICGPNLVILIWIDGQDQMG